MNHPVNERQSPPIPLPPTDEQQRWLNWRNHRTAEARPRSLARKREEAIFEIFSLPSCHSRSLGSRRLGSQPGLAIPSPSLLLTPPFPRYATAANGLDPKVKKSGTFISLM